MGSIPDTSVTKSSQTLKQLGDLIQASIAEHNEFSSREQDENGFPSKKLYDLRRTLISAAGMISELVSDPKVHLIETSQSTWLGRAFIVAANYRIADIVAEYGDEGATIETLAKRTGADSRRLSHVLRFLCSQHIFKEVAPNRFTNNRISAALVGDEELRAYILLGGTFTHASSNYFGHVMSEPLRPETRSAMQRALGVAMPYFDWLDEKVSVADLLIDEEGRAHPLPWGSWLQDLVRDKQPNDLIYPRPERQVFDLAMLANGEIFLCAPAYDYPWASLGKATVVDVGGGVGGFCLLLAQAYPDLKFVVQDQGPVLEIGKRDVWPRGAPDALTRVEFVEHDFFTPNCTKGADVYVLRHVLHDWPDEDYMKIVAAVKESLGPKSKILIIEQIMQSTLGSAELRPAPEPLLPNYGTFNRYTHNLDMIMNSTLNSAERTPEEHKDLLSRVGLKLNKVWECRSQAGVLEVVLA